MTWDAKRGRKRSPKVFRWNPLALLVCRHAHGPGKQERLQGQPRFGSSCWKNERRWTAKPLGLWLVLSAHLGGKASVPPRENPREKPRESLSFTCVQAPAWQPLAGRLAHTHPCVRWRGVFALRMWVPFCRTALAPTYDRTPRSVKTPRGLGKMPLTAPYTLLVAVAISALVTPGEHTKCGDGLPVTVRACTPPDTTNLGP